MFGTNSVQKNQNNNYQKMGETAEKSKPQKILITVAFIITFAISYFAVQFFFFNEGSIEEQMKEAAVEINNISPKMVDEYSRLDSASTADKTFKYHYTLMMTKEEVNVDVLKKFLRPEIIENVKNSPELKIFRENKITMSYNYYDKNGEFVTKIDVTPELY